MRDHLLQLQGIDTNLIALLFWLGYRREYIVYQRQRRLEGKSAWTLGKKLRYGLNSIFNFTDLPIQILLYAGAASLWSSPSPPACWSSWPNCAAIFQVPGYTSPSSWRPCSSAR